MSTVEPVPQTLDSSLGSEDVWLTSSTAGTVLADLSLLLMALLPIFYGALRSVSSNTEKTEEDTKAERISWRDAAGYPIIGSVVLLSLYVLLKDTWSSEMKELLDSVWEEENQQVFSLRKFYTKENVKLLLSLTASLLGVDALSRSIRSVLPASFPNKVYRLLFTQSSGEDTEELLRYEYDTKTLFSRLLSAAVGLWFLLQKNWISNNLLALSWGLEAVEQLRLNSVSTGCVLLGGLFLFDVFWVFGSDVMETVALSFQAPIKLLFPVDLLQKGFGAANCAMLGLGDVVVPGLFIALLLRFDVSLKKNTRSYFHCTLGAYVLGLVLTVLAMHTFERSQPALLYLAPVCVAAPLSLALSRGEITQMFRYQDTSEEAETNSEKKDQ